MGPEIDQIFRRLDEKVIAREVAKAAMKQLVGMHARSIAGFNTLGLDRQIDDMFERQQGTKSLPPSFFFALKSVIAAQFAEARRDAAEAARVVLISD